MDDNIKNYFEWCNCFYLVACANFVTLLPVCVLIFFYGSLIVISSLFISLPLYLSCTDLFSSNESEECCMNTSAYAYPHAASSLLHKNAYIGGLCSYSYNHFTFVFFPFPWKLSLWVLIRWIQVCCMDRMLISNFSWVNNYCFSSWPLPGAIKLHNHSVLHFDWILTFSAVSGHELSTVICRVSHWCAETFC